MRLAEFKKLFGGTSLKIILGATYDIFQNQSIFPWVMNYTAYKRQAIDESKRSI